MIKWIGQHIWDFTSRFRSDVYFEGLSSTKNNQVLLIDENEKVTTLDSFLFLPDVASNFGVESSSAGRQTLFIGEDNSLVSYIVKKNHSDGSGGKLYIMAGSATDSTSGSNASGGHLNLYSGRGTGSGGSHVTINTSTTTSSGATALQSSLTTWDFQGKVHSNPYAILEVDDDFALLAKGNMMFGIDSDDNETGQGWSWNNNATNGSGTAVMTLNESGNLQVDGTLVVDGSTFNFDDVGITAIQASGESFSDDDVSLMTSAAIDDRINTAVATTVGSAVDLTSEVSGILPVANGGTGASSLTDNKLLTGTGTSAVTAEANATYDGTDLTLTSATSTKPILSIENTTNDVNAGELKLIGRRSADASVIAANGDDTGKITFVGENNKSGPDPETITYSQILGETSSTVDGAEHGKISIKVAETGSLSDFVTAYASGLGSVITFGNGGLLSTNEFQGTITNFTSSVSTGPIFGVYNYTNDATGPQFTIGNLRGGIAGGKTDGSDSDSCGTINFAAYDDGTPTQTTFAKIEGIAKDVSNGAEEGKLTLNVASHDGEIQPGLTVESGDAEDEVDVTIGNGSASVVTVPGFISIGGHAINDIDVAGEFVDSDEHLMTAAAINDQFGGGGGGVTADPFSTTVIKVLPNQWVINDDAGRPLFVEDDTSNTLGVRCFTTTDEMYAWQKLPSGYKATHVQVHASASTSSAVSVRSYNYQTGADNAVSATTGDLNANIDITDIPSSATQDLVIKVSPGSGSTIVYGATVTIATI
jgi:hypothetical protein